MTQDSYVLVEPHSLTFQILASFRRQTWQWFQAPSAFRLPLPELRYPRPFYVPKAPGAQSTLLVDPPNLS